MMFDKSWNSAMQQMGFGNTEEWPDDWPKTAVAAADKLANENAQLREECSRLRSLASKQAEEIAGLSSVVDAVEILRDIGRITGCGHVDDPDGRRKLVNCVEQTIDDLREALVPFAAAASRPGRMLDCMTDRPLSDDGVLGFGVKVSAWKRAMELTGIIEKGN